MLNIYPGIILMAGYYFINECTFSHNAYTFVNNIDWPQFPFNVGNI